MKKNDRSMFLYMFSGFMLFFLILYACGVDLSTHKTENYSSQPNYNQSEQNVYDRFKGLGMDNSQAERSTEIIKQMHERDRQIRMGSYTR